MLVFGFVFVGLMVAVGILLLIVGVVGSEPVEKTDDMDYKFHFGVAKTAMWIFLTFILTYLITGWLAVAATAAVAAALLPRQFAQNREENVHMLKTEALAAWIEQLRDAITASGGIEAPLMRSAETGPEFLQPQLQELLSDMQVYDTEIALKNFGANVEHHICDMMVASYSIASREATEGLGSLLDDLSKSAQQEVKTYRRVSVSRKQSKLAMRVNLAVLGGMVIASQTAMSDFLTAYEDLTGQMVLALVAGFILAAYIWMQKLQLIGRPPRFFDAVTK